MASDPANKIRIPEIVASDPANKIRIPEIVASDPANKIRIPEIVASDPARKIRRHDFVCAYFSSDQRPHQNVYFIPIPTRFCDVCANCDCDSVRFEPE